MSSTARHLTGLFAGIALFAAGAAPVLAQQGGSIPQVVAYQGYLRSAVGDGDPVTGLTDITFELYDASSGGTALWTEVHPDVSVDNGVFDVALGSITPFASVDLVFDRPLYLAITVEGETMNTRLPLTSAPYALRAGRGVSHVSVSCPSESIGQAVSHAPAGGVVIVTIDGICEENLDLGRDRVVLLGANPPATPVTQGGVPTDGIRGIADHDAPLLVDGANDVYVQDLLLENAPGATRYGLWVRKNGSVVVRNVLLRNSYAGVFGNFGGFAYVIESRIEGNSNYGFNVVDAAHGRIEDSRIVHNVSATSAGSEGAVAGFRQNNIRFRGDNEIINAGDDGLYDENNPDAGVNDDNGFSIYVFHGVQVRQDGGHTKFVGHVDAGNQVQVSLRDPQVVGNINLNNNSLMDMRNSSTAAPELSARTVNAGNGSYVGFGRDNMELTVSGRVSAFNHSRVGVFRDSIVSSFGSVDSSNWSEVQLRGAATVTGNVNVNQKSQFNKWAQPNTLTLGGNVNAGDGSSVSLRGAVSVAGDLGLYGGSRLDLWDPAPSGTTNKTVVDVGGNVDINDGTHATINNTATLNVAGRLNLYNGGDLGIDGSFSEGCDGSGENCSVDNASAVNVMGADGISFSQYSRLSLGNGAVLAGRQLNVGPFGVFNLNAGTELAIEDSPGVPGHIGFFSFNQVFWNSGAAVVGNLNVGAFSAVNVDGPDNELTGNVNVNSGVAPGILNVFGNLTVIDGNVDCNGQMLDTGTVNASSHGGSITFGGTSPGGFVNCGP